MAVELDNVMYVYDKKTVQEKKAVSNITLHIHKGEFVAFLGSSGCGKSTLLSLIAGIEKPESGSVKVSEKTCLMYQTPENQLFDQTVLDDVMYGPLNLGLTPEEAREEAQKALELVGIKKNLYDANPLKLSGGQKRKVALAGILAMNRNLILLDEPTAGLDSKSAKEIMKVLKNLNKQGITVIVASHDCETASEYASRIIVLNEGSVVFDGTPKEMFENSENLLDYGVNIPSIYIISSMLYEKGLIKDKNLFTAKDIVNNL